MPSVTNLIVPERLSTIVQAGPAAVFLLMFIIMAFLFYSIRKKTLGQYIVVSVFYVFSIAALSVAYHFVISKSEIVPDDAHLPAEESAISQKFANLTSSNKVTIPLFSKEWVVAFRARLDVRQALREACKKHKLTDNETLGMQQYRTMLDTKNLIEKDLSDQISKFRTATYFFEWASDPPTNRDFSWAIGHANDLVIKLNAI